MVRININPKYEKLKGFIDTLHDNFENIGESIYKSRNEIKIIEADGVKLNVKAFKIPHLINKVAYAWIRGSKARHSYEYALKMRKRGADTPEPVAYVEILKNGLFYKGYYVSIHHAYDFTIRDIIGFEFDDKENILQQFADYTFKKLHKNGIHHLDYSRGNVLITRLKDRKYGFSIVDINRMRFERMPYLKGLKNFRQIWASEEELAIVARQYAKLNGKDQDKAAEMLIRFDKEHKEKINRKAELKRKIRGERD